jgi:hypothetical protein
LVANHRGHWIVKEHKDSTRRIDLAGRRRDGERGVEGRIPGAAKVRVSTAGTPRRVRNVEDWVRLLLTYVDDFLDRQSDEFRRKARDLIAMGKYRIRSEVIDDEHDENWGLNYVVELQPEDGPVIPLVMVRWSKVAVPSDRAMLDALDESPPDDVSSLS